MRLLILWAAWPLRRSCNNETYLTPSQDEEWSIIQYRDAAL